MSPSDVVYEHVPGVPGRYFRCARYGLMSDAACSRNFAAAPGVADEGRLAGCIGCPVGILHAGGKDAPSASETVCVRCRRDPADSRQYRSTRQGKVRMVRDGEVCVSCFNRGREVQRGQNARGTRPRSLVLQPVTVAYIVDRHLVVTRLSPVRDAIEAALTVIKRTGGTALVAWAPGGVLKKRNKRREQRDLESDRACMQLVLWAAA